MLTEANEFSSQYCS